MARSTISKIRQLKGQLKRDSLRARRRTIAGNAKSNSTLIHRHARKGNPTAKSIVANHPDGVPKEISRNYASAWRKEALAKRSTSNRLSTDAEVKSAQSEITASQRSRRPIPRKGKGESGISKSTSEKLTKKIKEPADLDVINTERVKTGLDPLKTNKQVVKELNDDIKSGAVKVFDKPTIGGAGTVKSSLKSSVAGTNRDIKIDRAPFDASRQSKLKGQLNKLNKDISSDKSLLKNGSKDLAVGKNLKKNLIKRKRVRESLNKMGPGERLQEKLGYRSNKDITLTPERLGLGKNKSLINAKKLRTEAINPDENTYGELLSARLATRNAKALGNKKIIRAKAFENNATSKQILSEQARVQDVSIAKQARRNLVKRITNKTTGAKSKQRYLDELNEIETDFPTIVKKNSKTAKMLAKENKLKLNKLKSKKLSYEANQELRRNQLKDQVRARYEKNKPFYTNEKLSGRKNYNTDLSKAGRKNFRDQRDELLDDIDYYYDKKLGKSTKSLGKQARESFKAESSSRKSIDVIRATERRGVHIDLDDEANIFATSYEAAVYGASSNTRALKGKIAITDSQRGDFLSGSGKYKGAGLPKSRQLNSREAVLTRLEENLPGVKRPEVDRLIKKYTGKSAKDASLKELKDVRSAVKKHLRYKPDIDDTILATKQLRLEPSFKAGNFVDYAKRNKYRSSDIRSVVNTEGRTLFIVRKGAKPITVSGEPAFKRTFAGDTKPNYKKKG